MDSWSILIWAGVAAFVLIRLWSVLGQKNEDEPQRPNPFVAPPPSADDADIVRITDKTNAQPQQQDGGKAEDQNAPISLHEALRRISALDPKFDEKSFIKGASTAFTLIVNAYAAGDIKSCGNLLAEDVAARFQKAIDVRRELGQTLETRIDRVAEASITEAGLMGARAVITVNFVSHQANILRDGNGSLVPPFDEQVHEIHDTWVFARNLPSDDPIWLLIATQG